jgi:hypothetical protein
MALTSPFRVSGAAWACVRACPPLAGRPQPRAAARRWRPRRRVPSRHRGHGEPGGPLPPNLTRPPARSLDFAQSCDGPHSRAAQQILERPTLAFGTIANTPNWTAPLLHIVGRQDDHNSAAARRQPHHRQARRRLCGRGGPRCCPGQRDPGRPRDGVLFAGRRDAARNKRQQQPGGWSGSNRAPARVAVACIRLRVPLFASDGALHCLPMQALHASIMVTHVTRNRAHTHSYTHSFIHSLTHSSMCTCLARPSPLMSTADAAARDVRRL